MTNSAADYAELKEGDVASTEGHHTDACAHWPAELTVSATCTLISAELHVLSLKVLNSIIVCQCSSMQYMQLLSCKSNINLRNYALLRGGGGGGGGGGR